MQRARGDRRGLLSTCALREAVWYWFPPAAEAKMLERTCSTDEPDSSNADLLLWGVCVCVSVCVCDREKKQTQ